MTRKSRGRGIYIALMSATILAGYGSPAFASAAGAVDTAIDGSEAQQTAEPADQNTPNEINDIVVTALKRSTGIQETPIAISAVSGDTIKNSGVQSMADLGSSVPSLNFADGGPSQRRVIIRGIRAAGEPTVGVYYDEVPVTGVVGTGSDAGGSTPELRLFDIERVEVLRGPQGTLYGSGSMGGTLRILYNKPTFEVQGAVDATLSATQHGGLNEGVSGMINLPIADEKLALRVVGFYEHNAGYIDNTRLNIDNINSAESYGGRAILRAKPTDRLTLDFAAYLNRSNSDTNAWITEIGRYQTDTPVREPLRDKVDLYSVTGNWELDGATITGNLSHMNRRISTVGDTSRFIQSRRTPARCATFTNGGNPCDADQLADFYAFVDGQSPAGLILEQRMKALTAELRASSSGSGPVNWTVGGFYSRRKTDASNTQFVMDPATGVVIQPLQVTFQRLIDDKLQQLAAFADVSVDITSKLNVGGGARYFKYKKDVVGATTVPFILVGAGITPPTAIGASEDGTVVRLNASYKFSPNVMVYAEASQGFRPGGVNQVLGLPDLLAPYESDKLWNYEVGIKTTSFDRRLTVNLDVFQIDWSNMQVSGLTPDGAFSFLSNAGKARVRGIEFETAIRPIGGLSIMGNAAYLDAVLTTDQLNDQVRAPGLKGDRIPHVPKFTAGASVQYDWALSSNIDAMARIDYSHASGFYSDFRPDATFTRFVPARDLANMRIGIEEPGGNWGAYLFVTNLFDATAITNASSSVFVSGMNRVTSAQPRTVGINVTKKF